MSAGLSGLVQGLANSPMGNLPSLMQAKQRMDMEKEKFEVWKADRNARLVKEHHRTVTLKDADKIRQNSGLAAAVDFLMSEGLTDDAISMSNINTNRKTSAMRERQQDYAEKSGDRAFGLAERQQDYAEESGDRSFDLAERQQDYAEESGDRMFGLQERQQDYAEKSGDRAFGLAERQQDYAEESGDRSFDLAERQQDYAEESGDRMFGLQERQQDYAETDADRRFGIAREQQDLANLEAMQKYEIVEAESAEAREQYSRGAHEQARATVGRAYSHYGIRTMEDLYSPDYDGFINDFAMNNSKMFGDELALGKNRIIVGMDAIVDEDGQKWMVPKIWNKNTKSVGPMSDGASARKDDNVRMMKVEDFHRMMQGLGAQPKAESKHAPKGFDDYTVDGITYQRNRDTSELTPPPGMTMAEAKIQGDINYINKDINEITAAKDFLPQENVFMRKAVNALAPVLLQHGANREGMAGAIAMLVQKGEINKQLSSGDPEKINEAALKVLDYMQKRPGQNTGDPNAVKEGLIAADTPTGPDRSKMPRPRPGDDRAFYLDDDYAFTGNPSLRNL